MSIPESKIEEFFDFWKMTDCKQIQMNMKKQLFDITWNRIYSNDQGRKTWTKFLTSWFSKTLKRLQRNIEIISVEKDLQIFNQMYFVFVKNSQKPMAFFNKNSWYFELQLEFWQNMFSFYFKIIIEMLNYIIDWNFHLYHQIIRFTRTAPSATDKGWKSQALKNLDQKNSKKSVCLCLFYEKDLFVLYEIIPERGFEKKSFTFTSI